MGYQGERGGSGSGFLGQGGGSRWAGRSCALLLALALSPPASAQAPETFAAGERWQAGPTAGQSWLPRDLALASGGDLLITGASGTHARSLILGGQLEWDGTESQPVLTEFPSVHGSAAPLSVEAAGDWLFELAQPSTGARVLTARLAHEPATVAWTQDLGADSSGPQAASAFGGGPALLSAARFGSRLALAEFDGLSGLIRLRVLLSETGALVFEQILPGTSLRALALSDHGQRLLMQTGQDLRIFDGTGQLLHAEALGFAPTAVALSGDGQHVAYGLFGAIARLGGGSAGYAPLPLLQGRSGYTPTALDLSTDGTRLAAGWWRYTDGRAVDLSLYELDGGPPVEILLAQQDAPGASLQNQVADCALDASGQRAAFGLWGTGDSAPEVLLFDTLSLSTLLTADLPGSVMSLDLSADGERLAIGAKDVHSNQLGSTGRIHLYSAGTADQVLRRTLQPGLSSTVHFAAPSSTAALLLVGTPGPSLALGGVAGELHVDLSAPWFAIPMIQDAPGEFRLELAPKTGWLGLDLGLQGVGLGPQGLRLASTRLEPPVL